MRRPIVAVVEPVEPEDLPPDPDADGTLVVPTEHQPSQHTALDEEDAKAADAPYLSEGWADAAAV